MAATTDSSARTSAGTTRLIEEIAVGDQVAPSRPQRAAGAAELGAGNVWLAGGSGITPMLGLLATMTDSPAPVTLLWLRRGNPPVELTDQLAALAAARPWLQVRVVDTLTAPRVTAADIITAGGVPAGELRVRMCGSMPMLNDLYPALTAAGVAASCIDVESFAFR